MYVSLGLSPKFPDPCDKEDRAFTQQEVLRALADLTDFIAEQGVFRIDSAEVRNLNQLDYTPTE